MKNPLNVFLAILLSVVLFLLVPAILEYPDGGGFKITLDGIRNAVILGVVTPVLLIYSRKIKSDFLFVIAATVFVVVLVFVAGFLFDM